ncbi:MAG: hypothetical protein ACLQFR_07630 [Streptosporangiaceae bacterium]
MPRKHATKPGTVSRLCACGEMVPPAQAACYRCWPSVPVPLQRAWLDTRSEAARAAIRDHLKGART